ncbi:MAG: amino acid adenylation domain-containing protein [Gemmatimonadota bacterium]
MLDPSGEPAPVGVPGELYIGGEQVARGYLDRPALTAEKFVPDPFGGEAGARLYRSGDRVRWLADGTVEFLGRIDTQVKLRGFRIEPGEVEAVLRSLEGVRDAVAVVRGDVRRLVAYVVPEEGARPEAARLREQLAGRLPEYMVPGAFVVLEQLPLNASGKVDRRALPAPEQDGGAEYVAPRTAAEEVLAGIWAEVLGAARVGAHDDFFALGGHSLLATQVVSRTRQAFGVELPLRTLFEAPTVAGLAGRVEALRRAGLPALPPVVPVERGGALPLSFAQERIWFLARLEPESPFYNISLPLRLEGALEAGALERALGELVRRHEALRTVFPEVGGAPVQRVYPPGGLVLPVADLSRLDGAAREAEASRLATAEGARPFDLARGPLLRCALLRLDGEDHVLCLTLHHVVSDGWSMQVLMREVGALYVAFERGEEARLPELPVQPADFAVWQRGQLQGELLERQLAYWRERLAGAPELLELPTDHARPAVQRYRGAHEPIALPPALLERLQALGRREGATLFMVLVGAFQLLLARYAGQEDVVVGTTLAGRTRRETEGLIGLFMNTLVLRTDLGGEPGFRELLGRVREATLGAYEHQDLPFERLVQELSPERSLSHAPLFQVLFELHNAGSGAGPMPGLRVRDVPVESGVAKYDLAVGLQGGPGGLLGGLTYSTDLFERATARRLVEHLGRVLEQVAADPGLRTWEVDLLGEAERRRVVEEWNRTAAEFPADRCIHQLFEAQAALTPDAPAVLFGEESLTYAELDRRANRLAHALRRRGVGPEVRVGICLERSPELMVALLGVLKAGGAYVPADPAHPAERIAYLLEDSGVRLLLTQERLLGRLPAPEGTEALALDALAGELERESAEAPASGVEAENLCYVIYTSGSTGRPKGVAMHHRGVVNYIAWGIPAYGADAGSGAPVFSSMAVDLTITNLLPLFAGHPVRLLPEESPVEALADALRGKPGFGLIKITPTHLALLSPLLSAEEAQGAAKTLVIGADFLPAEATLFWQENAPGVRLMNEYGPTETVVGCSAYELPAGLHRAGAVPVGGPIQNLTFYVLDAHLEPVPEGVPGELYIGGVGVARGYLGRAELSAEKFVPDPFAGGGARMYRTGDQARWVGSGNLTILGRRDNQVKIRGFRVELGEVEATLRRVEGVRGCLAVVREDAPGDRRLVAYVVADPEAMDPEALREHLRRSVPEYMVPSAFVRLDSLPQTTTGKFDPRSLPAPQYAASADRYVAPRTPAEEVLAAAWAEVLGLERVGVEESFFDLGGHSLLATRVVSRVREVFGVELPLRALFEAPTVAALAGRIEALRGAGAGAAPPVERVPRTGPLPLSFAQQRLWVVDRLEPDSSTYNMPSALRLRGALDAAALRASLDALVARHETLRTTFAEGEDGPVQVIHPPAPVALAELDLRGMPEADRVEAARRLAAEEAVRPFDLEAGPLLRCTLLRLAGDDHVLLFTLHHVVSDEWSMGVLVREVSALYAAFSRGGEARLPELPVQYADYAVWQRGWLSGETLEAQIGFWKTRLSGAPPLLEIPTDRPRSAGRSTQGGSHSFALPAALSEGLRELSRREGTTLFMTLLAGWQALLSRYSGQDDVVVGTPIAGRTRQEVEGLIGFFVNMLAMRADLAGDPTWTGLLGRVRETALGAYEHQELPFERLVEELATERSFTYAPVFQVVFSLARAGGKEERLALGGLALEPFGEGGGSARFDLTLNMVEAPQGIGAMLFYRAGLFEAETVARMAGHLETLLEALVADPARRLSEASLLRGAERAHLLHAWNGADTGYTGELCIHELVHAQVQRTPDAPALRFEGRSLSYAELYARASRLANRLRREGVGPEVRVGICMEPAPEVVVAVLGVLLAGGAYLPLDPELPPERRAYMLGDAAPVLLLTQTALAGRLEDCGVPLLAVDAEAGTIARESAEAPQTGVGPDNLAYVIYTSGSTGRPKGVLVEHRGVGNTFLELGRVYGVGAGERSLAYAPLHFDASVADLFVALCSGAELVLARREAMMPGEDLLRTLREERITHLKTMPSALAVTPVEPLPELKVVVTGGEVLPAEQVRRWGAGRTFFNGYGATEASIRMTSSAYTGEGGDPPIGRAVANTQLYVLDAQLEPAPAGVPGELYIGGVGVVRGYLNRPDLTAERFVPDPHRGVPGARLYRTGDVGRRRADGEIEFLGRRDFQVKVRGFRVELGEIEAVLRGHPQVREAVVLLREDVPGQQRLVAYVTGRAGAEPTAAELRARAAERLPEYMVPGACVVLDRLPTTANGKIDRRALPAPERSEDAYVAPRTAMEELLAGIWAEVLGLERVGVTESFFDLGGHSILATQVIARVRRTLGMEVPLQALFETPTVEVLARTMEERLIEALDAGELAEHLERLPSGPDGAPVPAAVE